MLCFQHVDPTKWKPTPVELKQRLELVREGEPFIQYADGTGGQVLRVLPAQGRLSVGRDPTADVSIPFDEEISRLHCELVLIGRNWVVTDDGLSLNGTFVSGERIIGRRRLRSGDAIRVGSTVIVFNDPATQEGSGTAASAEGVDPGEISESQRRVLVALCRPYGDGSELAAPASNVAIARELFISVSGVKAQLRGLFERFEVDDLPQGQKRARLAQLAIRSGVVSPRELD